MESIDSEGNVTPQSLGNYVIRAIMSLPPDERPRQRPIIKAEESGNVILASYPKLISPLTAPVPSNPIYESPTKTREATVHKAILRSKTKILVGGCDNHRYRSCDYISFIQPTDVTNK